MTDNARYIAHERRRGCPSRDGASDGVPPRAKDVVVCFPHGFPVGAPELQRARQPQELREEVGGASVDAADELDRDGEQDGE